MQEDFKRDLCYIAKMESVLCFCVPVVWDFQLRVTGHKTNFSAIPRSCGGWKGGHG